MAGLCPGATDVPGVPDPPRPGSPPKPGPAGAGAPQLGRWCPTQSGAPACRTARIACHPAWFSPRGGTASRGTRVALDPPEPQQERSRRHVNENDHPKGALLFMLVYLALLAFMWTNLYLKLWTRW